MAEEFAASGLTPAQRLSAVTDRMAAAARAFGREPGDIAVIAVSKYHSPDEIRAIYDAGQRVFAENRVQELIRKQNTLKDELPDIRWHLIGTLQSNKVKYVVGHVELIQSVDRLSLIHALEKRAAFLGIVQDILLQVNFAAEDSKHGFAPADMEEALETVKVCPHLEIRGLMGMGRADMDDKSLLAYFRDFKAFFDNFAANVELFRNPDQFNILSLGMSSDFEQAVAAGANMIRVGTALFGPRLGP